MVKLKEKPMKKPTDKILIQGLVTVWQGEGKDKKIIFKNAENRWVDAGLKGLIALLSGDYVYLNTWDAWVRDWDMYLGSDTATATTHSMTALTSPIGAAPGTAPNAKSGAARSNPATGDWRTSVTAIWYAGTISGTVGEMAFYCKPFGTYWTFLWFRQLQSPSFPSAMVSRLSSADGDFGSFAIDISKSLTVQWEITITYV